MRSTKLITSVALVGASAALALSGCTATSTSQETATGVEKTAENPSMTVDEKAPVTVTVEGSRAFEYTSLDQLAEKANAIVEARPTGKQKTIPLPEEHGDKTSAPTPYVEMKVNRVIDGAVSDEKIWVVSPGLEDGTNKQALSSGGPYVLFLTPAMYDANDPVGGYAIVGGPSGMFTEGKNSATAFYLADPEAAQLPQKIDIEKTDFPEITKTEKELLSEGP